MKLFYTTVCEDLAEIRAKFWIVKGRSVVRSVIHRCHICRRYEGKSYGAPPPPPLIISSRGSTSVHFLEWISLDPYSSKVQLVPEKYGFVYTPVVS